VLSNKKVYICFLLAFAMLAASPSRAAEVSTAPALRRTQVVKADPRTGKLVRAVVVSAKPQMMKASPELNAMVDKSAKAHNVDPLLVHSIISVESNYNAHAVSNKGAQGLMQLTPATAQMLGVSDSFDPQQNIEAGVKYLKRLKDLYKDDRLALAAYNAGPGAVDKYKKEVPPYAETQNYVLEVGRRYDDAKRAAKPIESAVAPVPELKKAEEPKPAPVETFIDENGRLHLKTLQ
jgi:soluble lytic murein transglycosylase-like protein